MRSNSMMNPADAAVNEATAAAIAAGKDPFGDDEDIAAPTIENQAARAAAALDEENGVIDPASAEAADLDDEVATEAKTEAPAEETATEEPAVNTEALEAIAADEPLVARTPQFKVDSQAVIDANTAELNTVKADALQKLMDGEMEPKVYAAVEADVNQKLGRLLVQSALAEANAQSMAQAENQATLALINSAKKSGELDYLADPKAQSQFDAFLTVGLADPDNAGKSYAELLSGAHANVLAYRGIVKAAGPLTTPVATKPPARTPEPAPMTLRGLPNASVPNTGGTVLDALGRLRGAEYQAAFSKLTAAQKSALIDE